MLKLSQACDQEVDHVSTQNSSCSDALRKYKTDVPPVLALQEP